MFFFIVLAPGDFFYTSFFLGMGFLSALPKAHTLVHRHQSVTLPDERGHISVLSV